MSNTPPFSTGLGTPDQHPAPPPFTNRAQFAMAMRDPRYAPEIGGRPNPLHDPAYRLETLQRAEQLSIDGASGLTR